MSKYEKYCKLRDSKNLKDANIAQMTGIGKSTFSDWKSGRSEPKNDKMQKIADCLGVSISYFTDEGTEHSVGYYLNDETAAIAQDIFENKELRLLFDAARDAAPEDLETVHSMLLALKRKEKGNVD
ncbi:helix-turn-helix [Clostridium sp. CAG:149]|nr:helix-turn-helix [Clostridium sp. CAG:149]